MKALIEFRDFSFTYPPRGDLDHPVRTLDNLNLAIFPGDFLLLRGDSGSGKSTLLKALCGLVPHESGGKVAGQLILDGREIRDTGPTELCDLAGMAFQNPRNQLFTPTVREEIAFSLQNRAVPAPEMASRIGRSLDYVGLSGFEYRSPRSLSGGEKQRLLLAILLAWDPPVFLLDEPLSALDPRGRTELAKLLGRLSREKGKTIIMAEKGEVFSGSFPRRTVVLRRGRLEEAGKAPLGKPPLPADLPGDRPGAGVPEGSSLNIENLSFSYPSRGDFPERRLFQGANFSFPSGRITTLAGANGSGKSTLASLIAGLLSPRKGTIRHGDRDLTSMTTAERSSFMGYLLQNPDYQLFSSSVEDEIAFGLKHLPPGERRDRLEETLEAFHLTDLALTPPALLGFSLKKRVTLACLAARQPSFSLLDEPDWGQDGEGLSLIEAYMERALSRGGGIILISHNLKLAARWEDRRITLEGGCYD